MKNPFRIGARVYLRPLEGEDLPRLQRWFNDPEVTRYLSTTRPMSAADERRWLDGLADNPAEVCLLIVVRDGDVPLGTVGLHRVGGPHRQAGLGIALGEKSYWNQGLGTEAMELILAYGFDTLNLHRIELLVYATNPRARKVYERVGFRLEGTMREARFFAGVWEDVFRMAILEHEYRNRLRASGGARSGVEVACGAAEPWPGSG